MQNIKSISARPLGQQRRERFLLRFDSLTRKYKSLTIALEQLGMPQTVYYRWKRGKVVPQEAALRRYSLLAKIDLQFVLTGIPEKSDQLAFRHYQDRCRASTTLEERNRIFNRIAADTLSNFQEEFPDFTSVSGLKPMPAATLTYNVDKLLGFEIAVLLWRDNSVAFEVYFNEGGIRRPVCSGLCGEGTILGARQCMRERKRKHLKKLKEDGILTPLLIKQNKHVSMFNGHFNQ